MTDQPPASDSPSPAGGTPPTPPPTPAPPAGSRLRRFAIRWAKRLAITAGVVILICGVVIGYAEHRTSQPEFCGSCHIMEPYYETWHADIHGGKLGVACIDCHYAPGERSTIGAKMRGLSQATSYFSGRYGKSRPRAFVDNRSCMTSKCHGDLQFMDKEIQLGTVKFTHAKHLQHDKEKQEATQKQLDDLTATLRSDVDEERFAGRFAELQGVARETGPFRQRLERMNDLVHGWDVKKVETRQLAELNDLEHRGVRLAQLKDLQCTNCHSYVAPEKQDKTGVGARHFSMKTTACYTCHFTNAGFNTGTASCLLCHSLPTKDIMIHEQVAPDIGEKLKTPELGKKPIKMDHRTILDRKVDCIACHADVSSPSIPVARRDCERCHDRADYFKEWKQPHSLEMAARYHSLHVPEQRAKCNDCHAEVHHQLVRGKTESGEPQFLSTVMANCMQCHPNQHAEQLELLIGKGGVGVPKGEPNMMFGSRTNCLGCHLEDKMTKHGGVARQGGVSGCIACHGDRHGKTFEQWKQGLKLYLMDAEEVYAKAQEMFDKAKDVKPEARAQAAELLRGIKADIALIKRGNGVHNVMYSMELLESVPKRSQKVMGLLAEEKP